MGTLALLAMLLKAAPDIAKLGFTAWDGYKKIVNAAKLKAGTPEEQAVLAQVEARMRQLDVEVANAPEPA